MKHLLIFLLSPIFLNAQSLIQVAHANGPVYAIAKHGNMTMIGGKFTAVNGVPAQNIAWSNDQVTWHAIGTGINDTVKDMAYFKGDFYIAGTFTRADTGANNFIVRWNPTTHLFTSMVSNQYYQGHGISNLVAYDSVLYASGSTWWISNSSSSNVDGSIYMYCPYNATFFTSATWLWSKLVYSITSYRKRLYGQFYDFSLSANYARYCNTQLYTTNNWQYTGAGYATNYQASSIAVLNGSIYTANQSGITKFDSATTLISNYSSTPTYSLYATPTLLYMGSNSVITSTGSTQQIAFSTNGKVLRMMFDTVMYFAGSFDSINGSAMGNVVKYQTLTPVHAAASYDSVICAGSSISFIDLSTGSSPTISWTFTGGSPSTSTANTQTVSFATAGNHQVRLVVSNATSVDTAYYTVHVGSPITLSAPTQVVYCQGSADTIQVTGFSGAFTWSPHTNISNTGSSFDIFAPSSTAYTIYASGGGCSDSITVNVAVNPLPPTPTITQIDSELHSSAATGNQWYFTGSELDGSVGQMLNPNQDGTYSVIVTDTNGCRSALSQIYNYTKSVDSISTGINELNGNQVLLYPNPVKTIVYHKGDFDLIGEDGRLIGKYKDEADLSNFPSGVYLAIGNNIKKRIIKQ